MCVYYTMLVKCFITIFLIKSCLVGFADFYKIARYFQYSQFQATNVMSCHRAWNWEVMYIISPFNPVLAGLSWLQHTKIIFLHQVNAH